MPGLVSIDWAQTQLPAWAQQLTCQNLGLRVGILQDFSPGSSAEAGLLAQLQRPS